MIKDFPFSVYDFWGCFVSGVLFLSTVFYILKDSVFLETVLSQFSQNSVYDFTVFAVVPYVTGHLLSFLSSVSIELFSIWSLDYPLRYLLGVGDSGVRHKVLYTKHENDRLLQNILRVILKLIVLLFVFPVMITDLFFRSFVFFCVCNGKII